MKKILVNVEPWESRVAVLRDDLLENIYFSSATDNVIEKAFFKGTVIKVFPGIQTAFVEIGQERAGFLHISEVDRDLAVNTIEGADQLDVIHDNSIDHDEETTVPRRASKASISAIFKEGQEVLVQVSKEPVDEKGAKLKMELRIEKGVGYVPASVRQKEETDTEIILIDAIFSPVKKVRYDVEATRVGQMTNLDKLTLEIETNGAISPEDALKFSSNICQSYFTLFNSENISVEEEYMCDIKSIFSKKKKKKKYKTTKKK